MAQREKLRRRGPRGLPARKRLVKQQPAAQLRSNQHKSEGRGRTRNRQITSEAVQENSPCEATQSSVHTTDTVTDISALYETSSEAKECDDSASNAVSRISASFYLSRGIHPPSGDEDRISIRDPLNFRRLLVERNINTAPSPDPEMDSLKKELNNDHPYKPTKDAERLWRADLEKCKKCNEAVYQRTTMMSFLDRHNLNPVLDYACEETWQNDPGSSLPRLNLVKKKKLSKPKPDLAVAFTTESLLPDYEDRLALERLGFLQTHMCPEGSEDGQMERALHFFFVEAQGKEALRDEAELQNLNSASLALHNIYCFMREAGEEARFFKQVRVFSATAAYDHFSVRIHRPDRINDVQTIHQDYPVKFSFDNWEFTDPGDAHSGAKTAKIVYNILFHYGVSKLLPLLCDCTQKLLKTKLGQISPPLFHTYYNSLGLTQRDIGGTQGDLEEAQDGSETIEGVVPRPPSYIEPRRSARLKGKPQSTSYCAGPVES
ncbi:hypothetical protein K469DRAFT_798766 [Zopfia rhizophila CBS 207.26]|uniref:DUF7924 domain-containing protein n=1 Tax=Zopfia rhizophila CBS 207.26 TaxID=1314779 RepID=A0A6A6DNS9_9PEZI|nr:hypothetical protein K469DRAFT_798766 [Zopfia rhizophila CBS 207.26]